VVVTLAVGQEALEVALERVLLVIPAVQAILRRHPHLKAITVEIIFLLVLMVLEVAAEHLPLELPELQQQAVTEGLEPHH
jgi:hypothetical protein